MKAITELERSVLHNSEIGYPTPSAVIPYSLFPIFAVTIRRIIF
ncbi:MAG: hypothetical protein ACRC11_15940 [Xenococcaceae cyanobacterium]